jgi:spermidine/putrescine transport system ATP-binding protein
MLKPMVVLEGITKHFGPITAVEDFNLEILEGEFITLLGPSGCGKTTVLRIIAGQEVPSAGKVMIDGADVVRLPAHRRPVNMVFQSYALFPHMTIFENIAFGPSLRKVPMEQIRQDVAKMLELVRLEGFEQRKVTQLSGGQAQRVALARALINQPKVLLLDEPLGALDLKLRKQMQLELKFLNRKIKTTFLYVTHDQEEALTMSDRIVVMNQGKIIQVGTPRNIYEKPNSTFVSNFVGETNLLKGRVVELQSEKAWVDINGCTLAVPISNGLQKDQILFISIRPDAIDLNPVLQGSPNVFNAQVINETFLGTVMRYELRIQNDLIITAQTTQTEGSRIHQVEEQVVVRLPFEKMVVLTS